MPYSSGTQTGTKSYAKQAPEIKDKKEENNSNLRQYTDPIKSTRAGCEAPRRDCRKLDAEEDHGNGQGQGATATPHKESIFPPTPPPKVYLSYPVQQLSTISSVHQHKQDSNCIIRGKKITPTNSLAAKKGLN